MKSFSDVYVFFPWKLHIFFNDICYFYYQKNDREKQNDKRYYRIGFYILR